MASVHISGPNASLQLWERAIEALSFLKRSMYCVHYWYNDDFLLLLSKIRHGHAEATTGMMEVVLVDLLHNFQQVKKGELKPRPSAVNETKATSNSIAGWQS